MSDRVEKHVKARVNPKMLTWAREAAGYEEDDASERLGVEKDILVSWERGESPLMLSESRKMGRLYSFPTALFSLRKIPSTDFPYKRVTDCRYLSGDEVRRYSPELVKEISRAFRRRTAALDLSEELDEEPDKFTLRAKVSDDVDECAERIRASLDLGSTLKMGKREFFSVLRDRIEDSGVLVFGMFSVEKAEASGFSYWFDELPVISVNVKLDLTLRIISLLRELVHLMLNRSVVSRIDGYGLSYADGYRGHKVEHFCDSVVREVLLPREIFDLDRRDWSVSRINSLSKTHKVSPSIVLGRMKLLDFPNIEHYEKKFEERKLVRQKRISRPRISEVVSDGSSGSGGSRPRRKGREFSPDSIFDKYGYFFVRLVIENYNEDHMTLADASNYLDVCAEHISDVERGLWDHGC